MDPVDALGPTNDRIGDLTSSALIPPKGGSKSGGPGGGVGRATPGCGIITPVACYRSWEETEQNDLGPGWRGWRGAGGG